MNKKEILLFTPAHQDTTYTIASYATGFNVTLVLQKSIYQIKGQHTKISKIQLFSYLFLITNYRILLLNTYVLFYTLRGCAAVTWSNLSHK